jgi:N-acetylneuraminic acid mutarotase
MRRSHVCLRAVNQSPLGGGFTYVATGVYSTIVYTLDALPYFAATQKYNTQTDVWESTNRIPTQPRAGSGTYGAYGAAAATLDDMIYVIGGGPTATTKVKNEVYNTLTDTWTTKASVPSSGYSGPFIGAWGGTTLIVGGGGGGRLLNYVHKYTPATDGWITGARLSLRGVRGACLARTLRMGVQ